MSNYLFRKILTDKEKEFYLNILQICPAEFSVFVKIKLAELIKPNFDFGTSEYISTFKELNKYTIDFAVFDLVNNQPRILIEYHESSDLNVDKVKVIEGLTNELNIKFYQLDKISELYRIDFYN